MMDNYDLWLSHDNETERQLEKRPICAYCGEHIQTDMAVYMNGEWICDDCIDAMRISVE